MRRTTRMAMVAITLLAFSPTANADDAAMKDAGRPGNRAVDDGRGGTETQIDDQVFVTKTLEASRADVEMAELALKKTTDPKVRDFAEKVMRDHSAAQAQLAQSATREGVEQPKTIDARHAAMKGGARAPAGRRVRPPLHGVDGRGVRPQRGALYRQASHRRRRRRGDREPPDERHAGTRRHGARDQCCCRQSRRRPVRDALG